MEYKAKSFKSLRRLNQKKCEYWIVWQEIIKFRVFILNMEGKFVLCENLDYLFLVRLEVESLNLMKDKYVDISWKFGY